MVSAEYLLKTLAGRGIRLSIDPSGSIRVEGSLSPLEREEIRSRKAELLEYLKGSRAGRDYSKVRAFAPRIGDAVRTPWGDGTLWSLTPYGASVDLGAVVIGFEFDEVQPLALDV